MNICMKFPIYLKIALLLIGFVVLFFNQTIAFSIVIAVSAIEVVMRFLGNKNV